LGGEGAKTRTGKSGHEPNETGIGPHIDERRKKNYAGSRALRGELPWTEILVNNVTGRGTLDQEKTNEEIAAKGGLCFPETLGRHGSDELKKDRGVSNRRGDLAGNGGKDQKKK